MTEPLFSSPQQIEAQFRKFVDDGDFYGMGPFLIHVLPRLSETEIREEEVQRALEFVIGYRFNDGRLKEALSYYAYFGAIGMPTEKRVELINKLLDYVFDHAEELDQENWNELIQFLALQVNYLRVYSENHKAADEIMLAHEQVAEKQKFMIAGERGETGEFLSDFISLFYSQLSDEEAADYASQLILKN